MIPTPARLRLGLCAIAAVSTANIGAAPVSANFEARVLAAQNDERARLGLGPLSWNAQLAQSAELWAKRLAASHRFEHAPENPIVPEGENLWEGTRGYFPAEAMVNAWIRERKYFKPGIFPDNSVTGNVEDVGHFTQLVWRKTTEVGCAVAENADDEILACVICRRATTSANALSDRASLPVRGGWGVSTPVPTRSLSATLPRPSVPAWAEQKSRQIPRKTAPFRRTGPPCRTDPSSRGPADPGRLRTWCRAARHKCAVHHTKPEYVPGGRRHRW